MIPTFVIVLIVVLALVGGLVPAGIAISAAMRRKRESSQVTDRLAAEGYVGVAFVRDRKRTGFQHGMEDQYRFELEVEGIDGSRFPAYAEDFLPRPHPITGFRGLLRPLRVHGEETSLIPVRYLPGEPRVALEPIDSPDAQEALARYNGRRGLTG